MAFIEAENLVKIYKVAELEVIALQGLDLSVAEGELLGIVGASGSGKSTFLNVVGGLDRPSAGRISVGGQDLLKLSDGELDAYRRDQVGFIWQQAARNLIPYLTAEENIALPMMIKGTARAEREAWCRELLQAIGLWEFRQHKLAQLSGGQQQRVAIGVALANRPALLLGDEPTGELDSATADEILALFARLNQQYDLTTIIVTHDPQVAQMVDRVVTIRDGRTSSESVRRASSNGRSSASDLTLSEALADETYEEYVVVDSVGRLQIPPDLREQIALGGRVTLSVTETGEILVKPVDGQTVATAVAPLPALDEQVVARPQNGWRRLLSKFGRKL